jgi:hypothetical protein
VELTHAAHRRTSQGKAGQCHRRSPHVAGALKPASATSLMYSASRRGENRPRKAAGCVCCRAAGLCERRAGVAAQGVQPHGTVLGAHGSHGRCYCDPLRCLVPSNGWRR